ncbi:MAG: lipoprotein [Pseudomonadota bacterium]
MLLLLTALQGCGRKGPLYLPPAQANFSSATATIQLLEPRHD